ncbi:hypothetical protein [Capnocytophaga cynodegmi]|uniref:DUF2262 domain-containing protein n=1 Tax=Capnocytophaga cynodegmi TaxID=28189 RepID=A0A0B7HGE9_9FLAO|nr:hypothetical protein [Capnocytophaga cynodegmi]ATA68419.1 hypothetical protein CGC48_07115 [Capnocytophaga cynodegmi]GIM51434.1 hypothetical protein CAPN004_04640 [Capnocytophaga cynodegmi]CEN38315.1 conserved hypothetical protein [Capnocytophaga cynodegmi]
MSNYQFSKEDGIAISTKEVYLKNLHQNAFIWVYTENENFNDFSPKQKVAFEEFLNTENALEQIKEKTKSYYDYLLAQKRIKQQENDSFELDFEAIALPSQAENPKNIVFVLANTNWLLANSKFYMELEIRFENGILMHICELSGEYIFPQ